MTNRISSSTARYLLIVPVIMVVWLPTILLAQNSPLSDFGQAAVGSLTGQGVTISEFSVSGSSRDVSSANVAANPTVVDSLGEYLNTRGQDLLNSSTSLTPSLVTGTAIHSVNAGLLPAGMYTMEADNATRAQAASIDKMLEEEGNGDLKAFVEDCVKATAEQNGNVAREHLVKVCYDNYFLDGNSADASQLNTDEIAVVGTIARDGTEICTSHILAAEIRELEELDDGSNPAMAKQIEQLKSDLANIKKYVGDCCRQFLGGGGLPTAGGGSPVSVGDYLNGGGTAKSGTAVQKFTLGGLNVGQLGSLGRQLGNRINLPNLPGGLQVEQIRQGVTAATGAANGALSGRLPGLNFGGNFGTGVGGAGGGTPRLLLECKPPEIVGQGETQNQGAVGGAFTREIIKQLLTDMTSLYNKRCECERKVFVAASHDPFSGEAVCAGDQLQRQINQNVGNTSVMNIPFYSNPEVQEMISRMTVTGRVEPLPVHECIWENKLRSLLKNANDSDGGGVGGAVNGAVNGAGQIVTINGAQTLLSPGVQALLGGGNVGSAIGGAAGGLICQMGGPRLSCGALASLIPSPSEIDDMADSNGMSSSGNPIKFYLFLYARTAAFYKAVALYTGFVGRLQQLNPYGVKSRQSLLNAIEKQFLSALAMDGQNFNSVTEAVNAFDKRNLRQFWIWTNQITTACKVGGNESDVPPDQGTLPAL